MQEPGGQRACTVLVYLNDVGCDLHGHLRSRRLRC